ncbi:hypothetical protein WDZ17_08705 [Pseudokineococcus basanitobsidens]|uniref:Uncharacterized protein n=1 Tax=Pseudokineococcus basanitobsidens TaxID=1926649 RepID=A0ABU8RK47_9ACTN
MSRDALGAAPAGGEPDDAPPGPRGGDDLDGGDPGPGPPPRRAADGLPPRRRRVLAGVGAAALLAAAFAAGERVGERAVDAHAPGDDAVGRGSAGAPSGASEGSGGGNGSPAAYAQLFPDEEDRRAATVVVSWGGVLGVGEGTRVVVAVVADEDTGVVTARLADRGSQGGGSELVRGDLAREVLLRAGEVDAAGRDVAVVSVRGRGSGTIAVEVADSGYQLTVATSPRVHLAVVEGDEVRLLLAVPVSGPRPRA